MIKTGVLFVSILFQTMVAMALKPDSVYVSTPYALGLKFQHTILPTTDGAEIDIWQIFADSTVKNNTTLIVAYGDAGNKSHWLNQAALMSKLGYDLVLFDYRGFGKSSPFEMNPNQLYYPEFVTDLTTVMQWNKIQYPKNKTGIWALSMGTIMATIAAQTEPVDFLIAEGFVADPAAIQKKIFEVKKKEIVLPQGDERYKEQVANLKIPILLFAGSTDVFTTREESKEVAKQHKNRSLIVFEGGHLQGFQLMTKNFTGDRYMNAIGKFIRNL